MEKVAIIMSTYNGDKYLNEQMESLLSQKVNKSKYSFDIWCRDDGSDDQTREIMKKYSENYENVHFDSDDNNKLGVRNSFLKLLKDVTADYYFFCDQDDVWEEEKVERFLKEFDNNVNPSVPGGVYSDLNLVDENNNFLGKTMMQIHSWKYAEKRDFSLFIFKTRVTGASFAINKLTRDALIKIDFSIFKYVGMHDSVAALLIMAYDNLAFIPNSFVNYRQHGNNVLGAAPKKYSIFNMEPRIKRYRQFFYDLKVISKVIDMGAISLENQEIIKSIFSFYSKNTRVERFNSIIKNYNYFWKNIKFKQLVVLSLFFTK